MRRTTIAAVVLTVTALVGAMAVASSAASAPDKKKPPVKLTGKVNNEGTKKVKGGSIEMEAADFSFGPTFIKGKPGETVTIELKNEGSASHTFTIDDADVDIDEEVGPGESAALEVTMPDTGATAFYCRFHKSSGMQGALFVKRGGSARGSGTSAPSDDGGGGYGY